MRGVLTKGLLGYLNNIYALSLKGEMGCNGGTTAERSHNC